MSDSTADSAPTVVIGDANDPQGPHEDRHVSVGEFFHWIYRFFYSKTVGLILILAFAVYALLGSVIAQTGPETMADPAAKEDFLSQVQGIYGGWTSILAALGLFNVFTSIGFYVVVALLALSILACTVHRIPELVRRKHSPRVHVAKRFFDRARYRACVPTEMPAEPALAQVGDVLRGKRFRVIPDPKEPGRALYADRNSWAGIGTVVAHASFIIILLAFVVSARFGIEDQLSLPVGTDVELGHETGLTAHAVSFQDTYTEQGQPSDYVTHLQLWKDGKVVAEQDVRVNDPLDYGGFRFHQQNFGIATDVRIAGPDGEVLYQGSVPMQWSSNGGQNAVGKVEIDEGVPAPLEVVVVTPASGATASSVPLGAALFELYDVETDQHLGQALSPQGGEAEIEGYKFSFERERQYTGLTMRQDPGAWWMWIGSILLVVGMTVTFMFPYRRLWVRADVDEGQQPPTRIKFGSVARFDHAYQKLFQTVIDQVDLAVEAEPPSGDSGTNPDVELVIVQEDQNG